MLVFIITTLFFSFRYIGLDVPAPYFFRMALYKFKSNAMI